MIWVVGTATDARKAALNMAVKTLAIEWQRSLPMATLIAYHPGTVRTALSAPFLKSGSTSVTLSPGDAAEHCLQLLDTLTPDQYRILLGLARAKDSLVIYSMFATKQLADRFARRSLIGVERFC